MRDLMDIAYITGQRPVDIVGIHSSHIHEGILHISQQKTGAKLRFEISGKLKEIIDRIHQDNGYLFLNSHGKPLTRDSLGRQFWSCAKPYATTTGASGRVVQFPVSRFAPPKPPRIFTYLPIPAALLTNLATPLSR